MSNRHILFVGGGTAGHISPLLAVMDAVQKQAGPKAACTYVGLPSDLDSPLITESKLTFAKRAVRSGKLHRHATWNQFKQVGQFLRGLAEARRLITELKPAVVFAKGGYSTVPLVLAAARKGIPIFCHESDSVPGLANRFVSRYAKTIFTSYPVEVYAQLPQDRLVYTGQPVRDIFYSKAKQLPVIEKVTLNGLPVLTVIGGSQGSRKVNQLISEAWGALLPHFQLVHVTGSQEHTAYEAKKIQLTPSLQQNLHVVPFLTKELPALFQKSAIVISRSGGTIAELAASRACTVLIPLSTSAQNHQMANARVLQKAGAAVVLDETVTTSAELIATIQRICGNMSEETALRAAIGSFDRPDAAARMAEYLLQ